MGGGLTGSKLCRNIKYEEQKGNRFIVSNSHLKCDCFSVKGHSLLAIFTVFSCLTQVFGVERFGGKQQWQNKGFKLGVSTVKHVRKSVS